MRQDETKNSKLISWRSTTPQGVMSSPAKARGLELRWVQSQADILAMAKLDEPPRVAAVPVGFKWKSIFGDDFGRVFVFRQLGSGQIHQTLRCVRKLPPSYAKC